VDAVHAAAECVGWFSIDGRVPELWDQFSGLYRTSDGWVRRARELPPPPRRRAAPAGPRSRDGRTPGRGSAMLQWNALASSRRRPRAAWSPGAAQLRAVGRDAAGPGDRGAAAVHDHPHRRRAAAAAAAAVRRTAPLEGVRVLDLTRILAGPVGGRALAAYGADVMLVNAPQLPNIEAIADTSRGKRSVLLDLRDADDRERMDAWCRARTCWCKGYRPGALRHLGYGPDEAAQRCPGIVYVSLSAYGAPGPWSERRGFDSLVQTAMGFNLAEAEAAGDASRPRPLPMQILDEATGYLIALGAAAALARQQREGGSWHVEVALARTGQWLRRLGPVHEGFGVQKPELAPFLETTFSAWGTLCGLRHSAQLGRTPARWRRPSERPGDSLPRW
jgi:hypothetical protein